MIQERVSDDPTQARKTCWKHGCSAPTAYTVGFCDEHWTGLPEELQEVWNVAVRTQTGVERGRVLEALLGIIR